MFSKFNVFLVKLVFPAPDGEDTTNINPRLVFKFNAINKLLFRFLNQLNLLKNYIDLN